MVRTALLFFAVAFLVGCKSQTAKPGTSATSERETESQGREAGTQTENPAISPVTEPAASRPSDPPTVNVGLGIEQAYLAIPHRRTIWREDESTVPPSERAYLIATFQMLDQAVAVRVAGQQNFTNQRFDSPDIDGEYGRLITYARAMPVPVALASYHAKIIGALADERQFFADWKAERDRFQFGQQPGNHPGVRGASSALRAAYGDLVGKYPNESQSNKDAFFDYHCALDFL